MKLTPFVSGLLVTLVFAFGACSDDSGESDEAQGSCTAQGSDGLNYCYEEEETDSTFRTICEFLDQDWSASPCDAGQYARMCVQEMETSTDDGQTWETVHYTYYFKEDSSTGCLGEETLL